MEGEGFPVRRAFAGVPNADLDPFIHMDQMGEVEYAPGEPKGTPWHPHRGFETVTYMIDGTFQHQDSIGGGGLITNGSTQWMTAGSGILHIERPTEQLIASGGLFHGIQLWVNLPAADKWIDPRYQGIEADNVLLLTLAGRRRARPRDRRRRRRAPRPRLDAHRRSRWCTRPSSPAPSSSCHGRREFNALVYVLSGNGSVGHRGRVRSAPGSWRSSAPATHSYSVRTPSQESRHPALDVLSSAAGPSASRSTRTAPSS